MPFVLARILCYTGDVMVSTLPSPVRRRARLYTGLAILACLLWASAFASVKIALHYTTPLTLAGMRFLLAGVLLLIPFVATLKMVRLSKENVRTLLLIALFQTVLHYGLFFLGMVYVRGAQAAMITGASPLVAAVMAHLLMPGDRLTLWRSVGIWTGIAGVVIISLSSSPWQAAGARDCGGMLLLILCQIAAIYADIILARKTLPYVHPVLLNGLQMGLGGLCLFLIALGVEGVPRFSLNATFLGALLWLALLSAAAFSIWFFLLTRVKVSALNFWKFLIPVFGALLSWIILPNESPDALSIVGMLCIGAAVLIFHRKQERSAMQPEKAGG